MNHGFVSAKDKHLRLQDYDIDKILKPFIAENDSLVLEAGVFNTYRSIDFVIAADIEFAKNIYSRVKCPETSH